MLLWHKAFFFCFSFRFSSRLSQTIDQRDDGWSLTGSTDNSACSVIRKATNEGSLCANNSAGHITTTRASDDHQTNCQPPHTHTCSTSTCVSHSTSRFFSYIGFISCSLLRETADVFSKLETLSRNKCQPLSVVYHCDIQHSLHTGYTVTNKLSGQRERNIIFPHYITALSWTIDPL